MPRRIPCPVYSSFLTSPDRRAFAGGDDSNISYRELEALVRAAALRLQSCGIGAGDRVGILAANSANVVAAFFALQRLGASAAFLNLQLTSRDWELQLKATGAKLAIGDEQLLRKLKDNLPKLPLSALRAAAERHLLPASPDPAAIDADGEAAVIFTSSTTGHNKGVRLTAANFFASADASNAVTGLSPGDIWAVSLPLYHVGGLGVIYRTVLAGATGLFLPDFSAVRLLSLVAAAEVSHLSLVPTMLEALIDRAESASSAAGEFPLAPLKLAILAGAASSPSLLEKIRRRKLPVISAWGMTETTAHCTCTRPGDPPERLSSVGRPFPHTVLRIVGEGGEELSVGQCGEIAVSGPTVCAGYLDSSLSAHALRDGWLKTNDLGSLDRDGYLTIAGRKDDMFISGGENIHAGEIEQAACLHPGIQSAAVVAVAHAKWGSRPLMFVEAKPGCRLDPDQIAEFLRTRLAKIKVPDRIIELDRFPRTAIGKVDYKQLRLLAES